MSCEKVRELPPEERAAHEASCPDCALGAALRQLDESAGEPSARVDAAVANALLSRRPRRAPSGWIGGAAAAAVVAVAAWNGALRKDPPKTAVDRPAPESYGEFYAIGPGPVLEQGRFAPVVRMRLPRREVARLGLPIQWETQITSVEVDVVVGRDGTAKAVRLVRLGNQ